MATTDNNAAEYDFKKTLKKRNIHIIDKFIKVERYINRPIASLIVRAVLNTRVTPNGLTYVNFLSAVLAAWFFSRGDYFYFVLGGIFFQISSIVDCADGMLARAKDMCSDYGAHLDIFLDRVADFTVFLGITVGLHTASPTGSILLFGLLLLGIYFLQINLYYITKSLRKDAGTGETGEARALMIWIILGFAVGGRLELFIYIFSVMNALLLLWRVFHFTVLERKKR